MWFDPLWSRYTSFNPLLNDADAFRVMVACGLTVHRELAKQDGDPEGTGAVYWRAHPMWCPALVQAVQEGRDARATARRAITLAASAHALRFIPGAAAAIADSEPT